MQMIADDTKDDFNDRVYLLLNFEDNLLKNDCLD